MSRVRRSAGLLALAWMLLGLAASAGSAFAAGGCCAMPMPDQGSSGPEAPCHSVAPTSCCEANAAGPLPGLPGAPVVAVAPPLLGGGPLLGACFGPPPAPAARIALASIVLRL